MHSNFKHVLKAGLLAAAFVVGSAVAHADTMNFSGTTSGSFGATGSTDQTLTFAPGTFSGTTSNSGYVAFGGGGSNFGTFTLSPGTANFNNDPFTLMITFSDPTGISGGQNSTFSALVTGSVTAPVNGGANVTFNPSMTSYSFANSNQTGSFTLNLNNVAVFAGQTASVTGFIQETSVAATPEPNSLMLLGTGFVSAAGMLMRRRKMMAA